MKYNILKNIILIALILVSVTSKAQNIQILSRLYQNYLHYENVGRPDSAVWYLRQYAELYELEIGRDENLVNSYLHIGITNQKLELFQEALSSFHYAAITADARFGKLSVLYARAIRWEGQLYSKIGNPHNALLLQQEALSIYRQVLPEGDPEIASSLNNIGVLYLEQGNLESAQTLLEESLNIYRKVLPEGDPEIASSLNNLGVLYLEQGNLESAQTLLEESLNIYRKILPEGGPELASSLNSVGTLYLKQGDLKAAQALIEESLIMCKQILPKDHPFLASSLHSAGLLNIQKGNLEAAQALLEESLNIRRQILPKEHPDLARGMCSLGQLLIQIRNLDAAQALLEESLIICRQILPTNYHVLATILHSLGELNLEQGNLEVAQALLEESFEISRQILPKDNPDLAVTMHSLGAIYFKQGNLEAAQALLEESLEISRQVLPNDHPDITSCLNSVGVLYVEQGNLEAAQVLLKESLNISRLILPKYHHNLLQVIFNVGCLYEMQEDIFAAYNLYAESCLSSALILRNSSAYLPEKAQKQNWDNLFYRFNSFQSFYYRHTDSLAWMPSLWELHQATNGNILKAKKQLMLAAAESVDTVVQDLYNKYIQSGRLLYAQEMRPIAEQYLNMDSLREQVTLLETALTRLGTEKLGVKQESDAGWQQIVAALDANELVISFTHFDYYNGWEWTDSTIYGAFVLTSNVTQPLFVPLFEQAELDSLLHQTNGNLFKLYYSDYKGENEYSGDELWQLIWGPLSPYLDGKEHIYFSASGTLTQLNLAALPDGQDVQQAPMLQTRIMDQVFDVGRVITLKDKAQSFSLKGPIAAFGGLQYNLTDEDWLASKNNIGNDLAMRSDGYVAADSSRGMVKYLPFSMAEVKDIQKMVEAKGIDITLYTDSLGLEEHYLKLAGNKSPQVLHLATHAAFMADSKTTYNHISQAIGNQTTYNEQEDPMYQSRLYLSGANRSLQGEPLPTNVLDGILTAQDVSTVVLPNTELVVLSACETGLGDFDAGEGVYGLQRAFRMVGVDNLLMTLYNVDDKGQSQMMLSIYERMLQGDDPATALRLTQQSMIRSGTSLSSPTYWASVVLVR
jgi:CHAT domain-containing protein/Tfp pilus assembly protein PilF